MATTPVREKLVTLVTTDILTPYKKEEIINVTEKDAKKLLTENHNTNAYGQERNPRVKVRAFDPDKDAELLLNSGTLNIEDFNRLQSKLHPDRPPKTITSARFETPVSNLLDEIDPDRYKDYLPKTEDKTKDKDTNRAAGAYRPSEDVPEPEEEDEVAKAAQGGGLRQRRRPQS